MDRFKPLIEYYKNINYLLYDVLFLIIIIVMTYYLSDNFRKQFPGVGMVYDAAKDKFISRQPYASWTLDANMDWVPPVALPSDADTVSYSWDEAAQLWVAP